MCSSDLFPFVHSLDHLGPLAASADAVTRARFQRFRDVEASWLDDYALFRALDDQHPGDVWTRWPEPLRARHRDAIAGARADLSERVRFQQYLQWLADTQWRQARAAAKRPWAASRSSVHSKNPKSPCWD